MCSSDSTAFLITLLCLGLGSLRWTMPRDLLGTSSACISRPVFSIMSRVIPTLVEANLNPTWKIRVRHEKRWHKSPLRCSMELADFVDFFPCRRWLNASQVILWRTKTPLVSAAICVNLSLSEYRYTYVYWRQDHLLSIRRATTGSTLLHFESFQEYPMTFAWRGWGQLKSTWSTSRHGSFKVSLRVGMDTEVLSIHEVWEGLNWTNVCSWTSWDVVRHSYIHVYGRFVIDLCVFQIYRMKAWMNRESSTLFFVRAPNYGYCASEVFRSWVWLIPS